MMQEVITTLTVQLLVCCSFVVATDYNNDRFQSEQEPEIPGRFVTRDDIPVVPTGRSPLSLSDVFNQRVNSKTDLCPTLNVMLFFRTGNIEFLRDCYTHARTGFNEKRPNEQQASSMTSSSEHARGGPVMASYSGRLLKRILQNMGGDGPAKVDFTSSKDEDQKVMAEKRAPLSINGALSSLVDMLRYETSRDSHGPKYAFHTDLLHMGK